MSKGKWLWLWHNFQMAKRKRDVNMTALFDHSRVKQHGDHYLSNLQRGYKNQLQWAANKFDCNHSKSIFETMDGLGVTVR